jgi:dCMP deaminase
MIDDLLRERKWDLRHLRLCRNEIATWSKDASTKVGALIVRDGKLPVAWGYNGPARLIPDEDARFTERDQKLMMTIHAEVNAILNARQDVTGCTLYVTQPCCSHCAAHIIQSRIARVVWIRPDEAFAARWAQSLELAQWQFTHAKINTDEYHTTEV